MSEIIKLARGCGAGYACDTLLLNGRDAHDFLTRFYRAPYAKGLEDGAELQDARSCERHGYDKHGDAIAIRQMAEEARK